MRFRTSPCLVSFLGVLARDVLRGWNKSSFPFCPTVLTGCVDGCKGKPFYPDDVTKKSQEEAVVSCLVYGPPRVKGSLFLNILNQHNLYAFFNVLILNCGALLCWCRALQETVLFMIVAKTASQPKINRPVENRW